MASYEGNLKLTDVMEYIMAHHKDMAAMDKISRAVYPFTTRYRDKWIIKYATEKVDNDLVDNDGSIPPENA